ncbi:hypothetical protein L596_022140 [Steinernema carpocapsae]|uniref:Uncharacterized protein n=1 Tax=Steinernema carpocapsae TaxID=34508 RepID=A0A4U5ML83_STECR|nr:hypothetical protein L596_022140 [Steinernema carpocapsae]
MGSGTSFWADKESFVTRAIDGVHSSIRTSGSLLTFNDSSVEVKLSNCGLHGSVIPASVAFKLANLRWTMAKFPQSSDFDEVVTGEYGHFVEVWPTAHKQIRVECPISDSSSGARV